MKLCTFTLARHGRPDPERLLSPRMGVVLDGQILDVAETFRATRGKAPEWSSGIQAILEADAAAWSELRRLVDACKNSAFDEESEHGVPQHVVHRREDVALLAPLTEPSSLRDCLSFKEHWIQCAQSVAGAKFPPFAWLDRALYRATKLSLLGPPRIWGRRPIYYKGNCRSVVGDGAVIRWPSFSKRLDFELEIAVYITGSGRNIAVEDASQYVGGYSLFNDFTARDVQFQEMRARLGPAKSKDFDTGNALGPALVTPDEVDLSTMQLSIAVNGETWSTSTAASLTHSVAETIAFISTDETLYPGDVVALGTVPNGCGLELRRWLKPGDTIRLLSDQLGCLENRIDSPIHDDRP